MAECRKGVRRRSQKPSGYAVTCRDCDNQRDSLKDAGEGKSGEIMADVKAGRREMGIDPGVAAIMASCSDVEMVKSHVGQLRRA